MDSTGRTFIRVIPHFLSISYLFFLAGPAVAVRGDRIRCTVMFENAQERDGKIQVPIFFTLNGKKIIIRDGGEQVFMDSDKPLYPYIGMTDGCSVLAKV